MSLITSVSPVAEMPTIRRVFPAWKAAAPAMSDSSGPNQSCLGDSTRSYARWNDLAVTGSFDGGENRYPSRMRMV